MPKNKRRSNPRLGRCFELSGKFIIEYPDWKLVHGVITDHRYGTGSSLVHAWVENGGMVYDPVLDESFIRFIYYEVYGIIDYTYHDYEKSKGIPETPRVVYDSKDAFKLMLTNKNYGPWDNTLMNYKDIVNPNNVTSDQ